MVQQSNMAQDLAKRAAGEAAAKWVHDGMIVGIGTGSTAAFFIEALAKRMHHEGLQIQGIPTSEATAAHATRLGIPLVPLSPTTRPDLAVDGADEVNDALDLIKGGGGALVREKLVAAAAKQFLVIADSSKRVETLGSFPLPLAVIPFAAENLIGLLYQEFEVEARRRLTQEGTPFVTDDGLAILDLPFGIIRRPAILDKRLKILPGVVETGIFINLATRLICGYPDGQIGEFEPQS